MEMEVLFAAVPVAEFAAAVGWYEQLFGRSADVVAHDREVMWRVAEGGWLYVVEDAERAGRGLVTISVPSLDAAVQDAAARGLDVGTTNAVGDAGRKAVLTDPAGNSVALIEVKR
jgi:predicted enzyme related to lactoylglutathione lyase